LTPIKPLLSAVTPKSNLKAWNTQMLQVPRKVSIQLISDVAFKIFAHTYKSKKFKVKFHKKTKKNENKNSATGNILLFERDGRNTTFYLHEPTVHLTKEL
jgi:hypothetical protein